MCLCKEPTPLALACSSVSKTCCYRISIEIPQIGFFLSPKLQIRRDNNSGGRGRDPFFFLGSMPQHTLCVDTV